MSAQTPIVSQTAWIALIPQLMFMGLLIFGFYLFNSSEPVLYGCLTYLALSFGYLALSFGLKMFFLKYHRQGMALVKQQQFLGAIPFFEKSYNFLSENLWLDNYRFLTLLDSSGIAYREMALCNIAFCYSQVNQRSKAIQYYKQAHEEFPDSGMAQSALRILLSEDERKTIAD